MPIIVVGMHRSGTSLVAGLLHIAGVVLGDEPVTRYSEAVMKAMPLAIAAVAVALSGISWYTHRRHAVQEQEDGR